MLFKACYYDLKTVDYIDAYSPLELLDKVLANESLKGLDMSVLIGRSPYEHLGSFMFAVQPEEGRPDLDRFDEWCNRIWDKAIELLAEQWKV